MSFFTASALAVDSDADSSTWVPPSNGVVGGYQGHNTTILRAMTAFTAIAWYNAIELIFLVFIRFKKYEGLYFWSLLVTSFAIIVYQLGSWGNMLQIADPTLLFVIFQNIGWIFMVVGQSLVLYSRLHIITLNRTVLRFVLWMIILNSTLMYIPTTTLNFGTIERMTQAWVNGYNVMERIQMTLFSVQEIIISAIYLWEVRRFLKVWQDNTRKLMYELIIVNILLILLDVALLSVEFVDLYMIETTLKGMVYSIKLKLEIGVLSRMVKIVKVRNEARQINDCEEDIDLRKYSTAQTAKDFFAHNPFKKPSVDSGVTSDTARAPKPSCEKVESSADESTEEASSPAEPPPAPTRPLDPLSLPTSRPEASRQSSIQNMIDSYPGRIVG